MRPFLKRKNNNGFYTGIIGVYCLPSESDSLSIIICRLALRFMLRLILGSKSWTPSWPCITPPYLLSFCLCAALVLLVEDEPHISRETKEEFRRLKNDKFGGFLWCLCPGTENRSTAMSSALSSIGIF